MTLLSSGGTDGAIVAAKAIKQTVRPDKSNVIMINLQNQTILILRESYDDPSGSTKQDCKCRYIGPPLLIVLKNAV